MTPWKPPLNYPSLYLGPLLPDKAIDLIDEAGSRTRLRITTMRRKSGSLRRIWKR